jgi:hypothetical protein
MSAIGLTGDEQVPLVLQHVLSAFAGHLNDADPGPQIGHDEWTRTPHFSSIAIHHVYLTAGTYNATLSATASTTHRGPVQTRVVLRIVTSIIRIADH